jgi:predicted kinase
MSTPLFTCGLPGAGKTTPARRLEQQRPALRLTADEWMRTPYPDLPACAPVRVRDRVEHLQRDLALRTLHLGIDVVIDWGLPAREERDRYRVEAQTQGINVALCLLDPPIDELRERLARRNAALPAGTFHITDEGLDRALGFFQRPTPEELAAFDQLEPPGT